MEKSHTFAKKMLKGQCHEIFTFQIFFPLAKLTHMHLYGMYGPFSNMASIWRRYSIQKLEFFTPRCHWYQCYHRGYDKKQLWLRGVTDTVVSMTPGSCLHTRDYLREIETICEHTSAYEKGD